MSKERPREPQTETPQIKPGSAGRFRTGVRGLTVVVACCAVVSWAARSLWESQHPAIAAARGLDSRDPSDRARAIRELVSAGLTDPGMAILPLIAALDDTEAGIRVAAAEALGAIGSNAIIAGSAGDAVRTAAAGLIRSLKDREPAVRIAAMHALVRVASSRRAAGPIDQHAVIDALAAMLGDRDDGVRTAALDALALCGSLGSDNPPPALVAALEDPSAKHRAAAIKALARFPCNLDPWLSFLLRSVEHDPPEVRDACWSALARDRPPAVSGAAIPILVAALGSRARIVRSRAARALEPHARDPRSIVAIPALLALLREPIDIDPGGPGMPSPGVASDFNDWDPAILAADLLGKIAPGTMSAGEVIAALAEVVRSDQPSRRGSAFEALGEFGPAAEPAVPVIIRALREDLTRNDGSPFPGGSSAARALGRIAPPTRSADDAIAALIEALDSRSATRRDAIAALAAFGARAAIAIPRLRARANDPDDELRMPATYALSAIEGAVAQDRNRDGNGSQ